jgi:hypothetical protein
MRSVARLAACSLALLLLSSAPGTAQGAPGTPAAAGDTTLVVRVELVDGSTLVGTVVQETAEAIVLRTTGGVEINVPRAQIRRMTTFEGRIRDGQLVIFDPNRTRLLFSPTARPLGTGQGYLAVYQLFMPFLAYGITDEISVAGGTILFPGLFGRVFYVAPKVTVLNQSSLSVALGGIAFGAFLEGESNMAGIGYGLATYGTQERAITAGVGFAYADGEVASGFILTLGGEIQVSNSIKLLTENYLLPFTEYDSRLDRDRTTYEPILMFGIRFFGQQLAVDLAGITSPHFFGEDLFPFIPWVGFAYNFGH